MAHKIYRFRFVLKPNVIKVRAESVTRRGSFFTARSAQADTSNMTPGEKQSVLGDLVRELLQDPS